MMKKNNTVFKNPELEKLNFLIGEWKVSGKHRLIPDPLNGKVNFKWIGGESFIQMETDFNQSGPPNSVAVIGSDDKAGTLSMLYHDVRGVSRIFEMKFSDNVWSLFRNFPGFSQRFTGTISNDGNNINGIWELSEDDINWIKDAEMIYNKTESVK